MTNAQRFPIRLSYRVAAALTLLAHRGSAQPAATELELITDGVCS